MKDHLYRSLVDLIPDAVIVLQDGLIVMANPAVGKLLGYTQEDIERGLPYLDAVAENNRGTVRRHYEEQLAGNLLPNFTRMNFLSKSGEVIPCEASAAVIEHDGRRADLVVLRNIADRLRAEDALRRSEMMHRGLFDNMLEGAYLTKPDGTILKANPALVHMLGYESEEELCEAVCAAELYTDPDDRQILVRKLEKDGELRNVEFSLRRKDGKEIIVLENARAVRGESGEITHYEGLLTDITDRIAAEEELRATRDQLQATLNALPDLLFETDGDGRIFDFRAPNPELLYCSPEEFLGKVVDQVLPKEASDVIMNSVREAADTGRSFGAEYFLEMDNAARWFELSVVERDMAGKGERRFVGLARDITDRKLSEKNLRQTTADLERERHKLSDKNIALEQVLEHIEKQTQSYRLKVNHDIEQTLLPLVQKLRKKLGSARRIELEEIEISLDAILSKDIGDYDRRYSSLSARESEICNMVKAGLSSKEIAEALNISVATVPKHRENIRAKLGIKGKRISLATYLRSHQD